MESESHPSNNSFLDEKSWRRLMLDIRAGQVLPVVGPELVTIPDESGLQIPLYRYLAIELAKLLGVKLHSGELHTLNAVACSWLLSGGSSMEIYSELRILVDNLNVPPSQSLLDLTSITAFTLFISTTFDPLICKALEKSRPGFLPQFNSLAFHPNEPKDLPQQLPSPFLYNILGTHFTYPDFVVWEEDYIEYICGLLQCQDNLQRLFSQLRNKDLLLIGSPFSDWMVRFFLRVAKGKRFSEQQKSGRKDYVADEPAGIAQPTIFFFEQQVGSTKIIPGDPRAFASELARQWSERYGSVSHGDIFQQMSTDLPRGAVFISYSHDDQAAAEELARGLMTAQVPVWMDKARLANTTGERFDRNLEHAIKNDASFFISLISRATESSDSRFVHEERKWAAERAVDGYYFYIPVLLEELSEVKLEPSKFANIKREYLPGGKISQTLANKMKYLVERQRNFTQPQEGDYERYLRGC